MRAHDFHLIAVEPLGAAVPGEPGDMVATARKRTRKLVDVVIEVFGRHPDAEVTPETVREAVAPDL